ncbi:MAG: sodium:proton antiporter NhaD [Bernardetiaceae bacterium]|nr:sodium:proton antiporter NhaD [Bernardetiaceae bacterium]
MEFLFSVESAAIIVFVVGYLAIALEHNIKIDKAAPALIIGGLCWTLYILSVPASERDHIVEHELLHHLSEIAQILFFLLGAMTIVEIIDTHSGFKIITRHIKTNNKQVLLWIITLVTFFLSALLDNLATTIVMVSIIRKIISEKEERLFYVGMIVISANAGGAWSPIGDVTTTMLWIGGQITASNIIPTLILPSLACLLVPMFFAVRKLKGKIDPNKIAAGFAQRNESGHPVVHVSPFERRFVFGIGVLGLIFVPIFKTVTHLPPYMGMTLSLGIVWASTEFLHSRRLSLYKQRSALSVVSILQRVDVPSVLFFLGILTAVASLQSMGTLAKLADFLDNTINNFYVVNIFLGLFSAIVDNVPLVAAAMGMYSLDVYPVDHSMWEFLAYCAGTGGSTLIIGSAAGVAAMGMENVNFMWYLKKIAGLALIGYFAGIIVFMLQELALGNISF